MIIVQNGSDYQYKESLQLLSFRLRLTLDHILDWPTTLCHPIQPCKPSDVSPSSPQIYRLLSQSCSQTSLWELQLWHALVQILGDHVDDVIVVNPRTYMIMMFIEIVLLCPWSWS